MYITMLFDPFFSFEISGDVPILLWYQVINKFCDNIPSKVNYLFSQKGRKIIEEGFDVF